MSTKVHHFTNVVHAQRRRYREVLDVDPVHVDIRLRPGPVLTPGESALDVDPVHVDIRLRPSPVQPPGESVLDVDPVHTPTPTGCRRQRAAVTVASRVRQALLLGV